MSALGISGAAKKRPFEKTSSLVPSNWSDDLLNREGWLTNFRNSASKTQTSRPREVEGLVSSIKESVTLKTRIAARHAEFKINLSRYAMYLGESELRRLHIHLDRLLNADVWPEDEGLPETRSLVSFLRWSIRHPWVSWRSLGFSSKGKLMVSWSRHDEDVTAEFFPDDFLRWTVTTRLAGSVAVGAGSCDTRAFPEMIGSMLTNAWAD